MQTPAVAVSATALIIVTKSLQPSQNILRPLKTCASVSLRYRKLHGEGGYSSSGLW